jgi:hypothetical protein
MAESVAQREYDILKGATSIGPINGTGSAWSKAFPLPRNKSFGWEFQFTSAAGTPDVKIELEQSNEDRLDTQLTSTDYVVPDGGGQISAQVNDELKHIIAYAPKVSKWARIKFTGINSNPTDTICALAKMITVDD